MQQINLRSSERLASKPKKCYNIHDPYDSEECLDNGEIDDIRDPDYLNKCSSIDQEYEVLSIFREKMKRWNPSEDKLEQIVNMFQEWYDKYKDNKDERWIWCYEYDNKYNIIGYNRRPMRYIIIKYIAHNRDIYEYRSLDQPSEYHDNPVLIEVISMTEFKYTLQRELIKIDIGYEDKIFTGFVKWYQKNVNDSSLNYSRYKSAPNYIYRRPRDYIVKMYIKTITKVCLVESSI